MTAAGRPLFEGRFEIQPGIVDAPCVDPDQLGDDGFELPLAAEFARTARLAPQLVAKVLTGLRYKPGWSFEPAVLPDGTVAVRAIADLEDHVHPGRTFRTSRSAPFRVCGSQTPGEVVVDAALRAVLSIEEHEIREQLVLDGKRSQPLDPHQLPKPTNAVPKGSA